MANIAPIASLTSTRIKVALYFLTPFLFRAIVAIPPVKHWVVDIASVDENVLHTLFDILFGGALAGASGYIVTKRVQDGNNPENPLPPVVLTQGSVERITGDVPKPPTSSE